MKTTAVVFFLASLGVAALPLRPAEAINGTPQEDPAKMLVGEWIVASKHDTDPGKAVFKIDHTYSLEEHHPDGTAVTHTGQYQLDTSQEPVAVDLCLGECGIAGSEWTTTFGILRFLSDDEAEIHFDPSGTRPTSFDGVTEANTHKMKREGGWLCPGGAASSASMTPVRLDRGLNSGTSPGRSVDSGQLDNRSASRRHHQS